MHDKDNISHPPLPDKMKPFTGKFKVGYDSKSTGKLGPCKRYRLSDAIGNRNNEIVATKVLETDTIVERKKARDEISTHLKFANRSKYIQRLLWVYYSEDPRRACLVYENIPGIDLNQLLKQHSKLFKKDIALIVYGIAKALKKLHEYNITHRNIVFNSVIINQDGGNKVTKALLTDLSLACTGSFKHYVSSLLFSAPEVIANIQNEISGKRIKCTTSADMWSLGVLLYAVSFRRQPFKVTCRHLDCTKGSDCRKCELAQLAAITDGSYQTDINASGVIPDKGNMMSKSPLGLDGLVGRARRILNFDEDPDLEMLKDLISHLLEKDATERYTACDVLDHNWLVQNRPSSSATHG